MVKRPGLQRHKEGIRERKPRLGRSSEKPLPSPSTTSRNQGSLPTAMEQERE